MTFCPPSVPIRYDSNMHIAKPAAALLTVLDPNHSADPFYYGIALPKKVRSRLRTYVGRYSCTGLSQSIVWIVAKRKKVIPALARLNHCQGFIAERSIRNTYSSGETITDGRLYLR